MDPAPLLVCSPTRLLTFAECPRRYRWRYLARPAPRPRPWTHLAVGTAVHAALAALADQPWPGGEPAVVTARVRGALARRWPATGFRDREQSAAWAEAATAWVSAHVQGWAPGWQPLGVERTVALRAGALAVQGRVDRLDEREGQLVVVDYKTGRQPATPADARGSLALGLYAAAAEATLHRACSRVELHHLPSGTTAAALHTAASLKRHLDRAQLMAADIRLAQQRLGRGQDPDAAFPARPGPGCSWCEARDACPEGRAVSPELPLWAGLGSTPPDRPGEPAGGSAQPRRWEEAEGSVAEGSVEEGSVEEG